jgi:hypothetical protein
MARPPRPPLPEPAAAGGEHSGTKRLAIIVCFVVAALGVLWSLYLFATGHPQSGVSVALIPVAAIVVSRLVPRGWRG